MDFENIKNPILKNTSIISAVTLAVSFRDASRNHSKIEIVNEITQCEDACEFYYENVVSKRKNIRGLTKAGVGATIINAYLNGYNYDLLLRFCEVFTSGIPSNEKDIGIIKLRDYALTNSGSGKEIQHELYYRAQNILKAYSEGKALKLCKSACTEHYSFPKWNEGLKSI